MAKKRGSRKACINALAYCVESLCGNCATVDALGAVRCAIAADDRIWNYLDARTIETLRIDFGHLPPEDNAE